MKVYLTFTLLIIEEYILASTKIIGIKDNCAHIHIILPVPCSMRSHVQHIEIKQKLNQPDSIFLKYLQIVFQFKLKNTSTFQYIFEW